MKEKKIRLFTDFDGTVTDKDVGNAIFDRFLRPELLKQGWHREILDKWKAGRISSRECLTLECENTIVSEQELNAELDKYELTDGFVEFAEYCKKNSIPLIILSDGLDYYIKYILVKYGLGEVEYCANHMFFYNGSLGAEFPFANYGCGRCGNCKRWHINTLRRDDECVVYVGDGYSDQYAIRSADITFAKSDLAEYYEKALLDYFPYENFYDVLQYLEDNYG